MEGIRVAIVYTHVYNLRTYLCNWKYYHIVHLPVKGIVLLSHYCAQL